MSTTTTKADELQRIGQTAYESIAEMIAATQCDFDRLQELRDERDEWTRDESADDLDPQTWEQAEPDDAAELADLEDAAGDCDDEDDAAQQIQDNPLSVQVRSGWSDPGSNAGPSEFEILLAWGGPAVRIRGELNDFCEPINARLETQDWFTPWTEYRGGDESILLEYCGRFWFGE